MGSGNSNGKKSSLSNQSTVVQFSLRKKKLAYKVSNSARACSSPMTKFLNVLCLRYPNIDDATIWMMSEQIISAVAYLTPKGRLYILFQTIKEQTIKAEVRIESDNCEVILRANPPKNYELFKTSPIVRPSNPLKVRDIVERSRTFKLSLFENYQSYYYHILGEDFPELTDQLFCWTWLVSDSILTIQNILI